MNEEELNVKEEEMFLYQILEEHIENDKKHFRPCQECIRLGLQKGFQKGKLKQKKEELDFLKVFTQRDMHLHIKESDGTPRIVCDYNLILDRIKQLQKEIGGIK